MGRELDGRTYDEYPTIVPSPPPAPAGRKGRMAAMRDRLQEGAIAAE